MNLAAYVSNNPIGYRDPSGHLAPLIVLPIAGCLGGAAGAAVGNAMTGRKTTWRDLAFGCSVGAGLGLGTGIGFGAGAAPLVDVVFGHGARHLAGTTLSQAAVEAAILGEIQSIASSAQTGEFWSKISIDGYTILYRAYTMANGAINVGTYYPVK